MFQGVGIRIADDGLALAALERCGTKIVLTACAQIEYKDKRFVQDELERLFAKNRWDRHAVVVAIGAKHCIFRKIEVPFSEVAQISQIIYSAAEPHIQSYAIEDLVLDYHIVNSGAGKTKLLAVASKRENIEGVLALVESCGIYPYAVEIDIFGAVHLAQWVEETRSCRRLLLLDVERDGFNLAFLENGHLTSVRCARFHVRSLLDGMAEAVDDTVEIQIQPVPQVPTSASVSSCWLGHKFYERILKELRRTLANLDQVERIYVSGPAQLIQGLPPFLAKNGIDVTLWDIARTMEVADGIANEALTTAPPAIGLALKALGATSGGINLRQGNFRYTQAFDMVKFPIAAMVTLLLALFSLSAYYLHTVCREQSQTYDGLVAQAMTIYRQADPDTSLDHIDKWHTIYYVRNRVEEICREPNLPAFQDACTVWAKIFQALNTVRNAHLFTVESLSIDQEYAQFAGRSETDLALDAIRNSLAGAAWIAPGADRLRVLSTEPIAAPTNPKLKRKYKYQIQLKAQ